MTTHLTIVAAMLLAGAASAGTNPPYGGPVSGTAVPNGTVVGTGTKIFKLDPTLYIDALATSVSVLKKQVAAQEKTIAEQQASITQLQALVGNLQIAVTTNANAIVKNQNQYDYLLAHPVVAPHQHIITAVTTSNCFSDSGSCSVQSDTQGVTGPPIK